MSLKRMFAKMAIAFIAAKGVEAYRKNGGLKGIQEKMKSEGGSLDTLLGSRGSSTAGGLGGILGSLGMGRASQGQTSSHTQDTDNRSDMGGIMGQLAGATHPEASAGKIEGLLAQTRKPDMDEERSAGLAIRAMIQAVRADGNIDDEEHAALTEILGNSDPSDQKFVDQALDERVDAAALAADVPPGAETEVYTAALLAIDPDNRAEAEFLHALATGLSMSEADVNDIHAAMAKTPLY